MHSRRCHGGSLCLSVNGHGAAAWSAVSSSGYDICCELGMRALASAAINYGVAVTRPSPRFVTEGER
jgi:hypothetical protein